MAQAGLAIAISILQQGIGVRQCLQRFHAVSRHGSSAGQGMRRGIIAGRRGLHGDHSQNAYGKDHDGDHHFNQREPLLVIHVHN